LGTSDGEDEETKKSMIKLAGRRRLCKALPKEDEADGYDDPDLVDFYSPGNFEISPDFRVFANPCLLVYRKKLVFPLMMYFNFVLVAYFEIRVSSKSEFLVWCLIFGLYSCYYTAFCQITLLEYVCFCMML